MNKGLFTRIPIAALRIIALLLLLNLGGCAKLIFSDFDLSGLKGLQESFDGLRGIGELFSYPERARRPKDADKTSTLRCAASMHNPKQTLCLESGTKTGNRWWYNDANGEKQPLPAETNEAESIGAFEVDRDWRYVAIISAEEGHPMLAVYDLEAWIGAGKRPSPAFVLNPYPGTVHLIGWANNQFLHALTYGKNGLSFETDGPISLKEAATGTWPMEKMRDFRWDRYSMKTIRIPPPEQAENEVKRDKKEEKN